MATNRQAPTEQAPTESVVSVDLVSLQEALFGNARDASIGQQIEVGAVRLDHGQPHQHAALDTWHLDGRLKARAGRRWPGYLQHHVLDSEDETQRNPLRPSPMMIMSDSRHNWNGLVGWGTSFTGPPLWFLLAAPPTLHDGAGGACASGDRPEATTSAVQPSKPAKKRQAKRRKTDEEKARKIAARYGFSW